MKKNSKRLFISVLSFILLAVFLLSACNKGEFELNVRVLPDGAGTVTPNKGSYSRGTQITLSASPSNGYRFSGWQGDLLGEKNPAQILINSTKSITAKFTKTWTLSVNCDPDSAGSLNYLSGEYDDGSKLNIEAVANYPYVFDHWGNDENDRTRQTPVTMDADITLKANFVKLKANLPLIKTGKFSGSDVNIPVLLVEGQWVEVELITDGDLSMVISDPVSLANTETEWIGEQKRRFQADNKGSYNIRLSGDPVLLNLGYELRLVTYSKVPTTVEKATYFQCDFTKTYPSLNLDFYQNFYYPEPTPYPNEKGVWNWLSVRTPENPYSGTISLVPDPANLNQACVEFRLDAEGSRPLGGDQHSKVYEVQERQSQNYIGAYLENKEAWYNFKVWIPRNFEVKTWRLIWQSYGDPVPSSGTGGPQLAIYNYASSGWLFVIKRANADGGNEHDYPLIATADFPRERWVQVSIYWRQGSAWKSQDGTIKVWVDGVERLNRNDLETATQSGSPFHTWGIGNYGGPSEEYGQLVRFKEVNVSNKRDIW